MSKPSIKQLEELASKATPELWENVSTQWDSNSRWRGHQYDNYTIDRNFIRAAANPAAITSLLADWKAMQERLSSLIHYSEMASHRLLDSDNIPLSCAVKVARKTLEKLRWSE